MATKPTKQQQTARAPGRPSSELEEGTSSPAGEPETQGLTADAPEPVKHRLAFPAAPAAKIGDDVLPLLHIRRALEEAGYRNHPQALEAALEKVEAVPLLRASREVKAYRSEVVDCLRGKIKQRDERAQQ